MSEFKKIQEKLKEHFETMLNRQFIGIDKEEDFLRLTIKRINALKK